MAESQKPCADPYVLPTGAFTMNGNIISIHRNKPDNVYCSQCGCHVGAKYLDDNKKPFYSLGDNGHVGDDTDDWICRCGHVVDADFE
jgi:hypothetical protein